MHSIRLERKVVQTVNKMKKIGSLLSSKKVVILMSVLLFFFGIILKSQATHMHKRYKRSGIQNLTSSFNVPEPDVGELPSESTIDIDRETTSDIGPPDSYGSSNEGENPRNYTKDRASERNGTLEETGTLASTLVKTMELAESQNPEIYRFRDPLQSADKMSNVDDSAADVTQQPFLNVNTSLRNDKSTKPLLELMDTATTEGPELMENPLTQSKTDPRSTIIYEKETISVENTKYIDRQLSPENHHVPWAEIEGKVKAEAKIKLGELCNQDKYYVCGLNADCQQVGRSLDFVCVCKEGFEPEDGVADCVKADKELIMASNNGQGSGDHTGDISRIEEITSVTLSSDYIKVNTTAEVLLAGHGEDCEPVANDVQQDEKRKIICVESADCILVNTLFKTYWMCQCGEGFLNTSKGKCVSKELIEEESSASNESGKAILAFSTTTGLMLLSQMCLLCIFNLLPNEFH